GWRGSTPPGGGGGVGGAQLAEPPAGLEVLLGLGRRLSGLARQPLGGVTLALPRQELGVVDRLGQAETGAGGETFDPAEAPDGLRRGGRAQRVGRQTPAELPEVTFGVVEVIEHLYVIVDHRQVLSRISGRESGLAGACQTRPVFLLRFDFRAPGPTPAAELYEAALDMVEWGEGRGCLSVAISEHHASEDGYLPSPLVMTAAMATRTTTTPFMIAALLLLMYDPIKLAEDLNVLDHLSRGRVTPIIGLGYRPEEFAMFGVDPARRGAEMEERLEVLQAALAGEPVPWRGRPATVRPLPYTAGGMRLAYGGGSPAAARRAARFGLDFIGE